MPDLKDHSSRVFVSLSAVHLCSPVGSMRYSGTWNLPAAIACAFCFQSLLAAMLAACFYVLSLLFKGTEKDGCKKRKISSSFLPAQSWKKDMSLSTILLLGTTSAMPSLLRVQSTSVQQPHLKVPAVLSIQVPGKRNTRSSLSSFSSKGRSACQRPLSEGVWRRSCRESLAWMVWMCMPR